MHKLIIVYVERRTGHAPKNFNVRARPGNSRRALGAHQPGYGRPKTRRKKKSRESCEVTGGGKALVGWGGNWPRKMRDKESKKSFW